MKNDNYNRGIFLGTFNGKELWLKEPLSVNLTGPSGSGKTSCYYIPTLLASRANTPEENRTARSWIVNDNALQAYAVTHQHLIDNGYDVGVLTAWPKEYEKLNGLEVDDVGIDYFDTLDISEAAEETIRDEVEYRIDFFLTPLSKDGDNNAKYFMEGAKEIIETIALFEISCGRKPSPISLNHHLMGSDESINELFISCMESSAFDGHIARSAATYAGIMNAGGGEQWTGYKGYITNALKRYSRGSAVGRHVSGSTLDVRKLKSDKKPFVLFVGYLGRFNVTHAQMKASEWNYLLEMVCATPGNRHVTALIDESSSVYFPGMLRYLSEGRKYKLSIVNGFQEIFGQTEQTYGRVGASQIYSAGAVNVFTQVRDKDTCKVISDLTGMQPMEDYSITNRSQSSSDPFDLSLGLSTKGKPLFGNVRTDLASDEALILYKNLHPIIAQKVPYYTRPEWLAAASPDPYES